jgi:hypothetical protein
MCHEGLSASKSEFDPELPDATGRFRAARLAPTVTHLTAIAGHNQRNTRSGTRQTITLGFRDLRRYPCGSYSPHAKMRSPR